MKKISFEYYINILHNNNIIAYPTESIFSLGCNPDSDDAILKLLKLKKRNKSKGFILVASEYRQLLPYINENKLSKNKIKKMLLLWSGFITFLVPCNPNISRLITGNSNFIAVRVTNHFIVKKLCYLFGKPIISTSANISGMQAARKPEEVIKYFGNNLPILRGMLGEYLNPSKIFNIITGEYIRNV